MSHIDDYTKEGQNVQTSARVTEMADEHVWRPPDGGYGWVVLAASVFLMMIFSCCFCTSGIYFLEFEQVFDSSKTAIAGVAAIKMTTLGLTGFVVGPLVEIYGPHKVVILGTVLITVGYILTALLATSLSLIYLTFGFIPGLGYCCYIVSYPASLRTYFDKRYSLALGIAVAGISTGTFIWPPLVTFFIRNYGWKGSMLITAGIQFNGFVVGMIMMPPLKFKPKPLLTPNENQNKSSSKASAGATFVEYCKSLLDPSLFKNFPFMLYCIGKYLQEIGHVLPWAYLPVRGVALGATPTEAALLVSIAGILGGIFRVIFGFVGDKAGSKRIYLNGIFTCVTGALTAGSVLIQTYSALAVYAAAFGVLSACYISLNVSCIADLCGREVVSKAFGIVLVAIGLCNLTSNSLSGLLLDITGDPKYPFLVLGLVQVAGGVVILVCALVARWMHKNQLNLRAEKRGEVTVLEVDAGDIVKADDDERDVYSSMLKHET